LFRKIKKEVLLTLLFRICSFFLLGLLALNQQGLVGALFLLFSHAFISSALFLLAGSIYGFNRFKSKVHSYLGKVLLF